MTTDDVHNAVADTPTPAPAAVTQRDRQRVALRDLVALATECAATESEIETRFRTTVEAADKDFEQKTWATEDRLKTLRESAEMELQQRQASLAAQYQAETKKIQAADRAARQRVDHEHTVAQNDIKEKLQQAVWLAESLYDGAVAQIREEAKKTAKQAQTQVHALEEIAGKSVELVQRYNQLPPPVEAPAETDFGEGAEAAYNEQKAIAEQRLATLGRLPVARMFIGVRPHLYFFAIMLVSIAAVFGWRWAKTDTFDPPWQVLGIVVGAVAALTLGGLALLRIAARRHVRDQYVPLHQALALARQAAEQQLRNATKVQDEAKAAAMEKRKQEEQQAREKCQPFVTQAQKRREAMLAAAQAELDKRLPQLEQHRDRARAEIEEAHKTRLQDLQRRYENDITATRQRHQKIREESQQRYTEARQKLEKRLADGLASIQAPIEETDRTHGQDFRPWDDESWRTWVPPRKFASMIRFGQLHVDLRAIADSVPGHGQRQLDLPDTFAVPASLAFPRGASLLIQTEREGRDDALRTLQMLMARLLTFLPAGRVKFTIIDPVGLGQNFAGFMHLADHDDSLVGGRIWTDPEQIEQRLIDLTEHMETVIQKYLRNEYETIDDYNAQAGELAEPYRFLVVADFPVGFEGESYRRLASIANTGARCGVYTLIMHDIRQGLTSGAHIEDVSAGSVTLVRENGRFVWKDEVFGQFPLTLDPPPSDEFLTRTMDVVGRHAKEAKRVEVDFDSIAPTDEQFWTGSTREELRVPVGRMGATRLQLLRLGKGVAQHVLTAGKTGSGKSTLLHALVTNLAMWYDPDEIEFYLVDFKKGVEFKTYATHMLPHARAIAVESDREFGLSVLQRIDAELSRRGAIFRKLGVQDLASYRQSSGQKMPRTLLIIDEFQEFFSEDDKIAQDSALLLDRLVRQGRAFGIHVLLGSQTIGGTSGLARSTIGQMAVRIALQCSEADSQMILGDNNSAARLLSRPGEAIYNDAGGLVEANSPFQIAWLPDERREVYLKRVRERADKGKFAAEPPIVFEGNAPADIARNPRLARVLSAPAPADIPAAPIAWIGEPVAIKDPTSAIFRRQSGANMLLVGQQEEGSMSILLASMISLSAQHPAGGAIFYVLDGTPADSPLTGAFEFMRTILPHEVRLIEWRAVPDAMAEIAAEMDRRQAEPGGPSIYVVIYGLQRYRVLRKQEESFSFGGGDEEEGEKKPQPDKVFGDLLREGPHLGLHVLTWADTPASVERTLDRNAIREFDNRVLFQMSANDSSNLIDSPMANKLGFYRALLYSEEQGVMEKFRPYALPSKAWLESIKAMRKS